ncbi:MAG: GNAT family protein [Paracoccaceae bacterium]
MRLLPLGVGDLARVAHIRVSEAQAVYSGQVSEAFERAEADVDFHAIEQDGALVGFFKIDRAYQDRFGLGRAGEIGLRGFLIDRAHQGRGLAQAALAVMPAYLRGLYPQATALLLTVNTSNVAARACYDKAGFVPTGETRPEGRRGAGTQHVLRLALRTPDGA